MAAAVAPPPQPVNAIRQHEDGVLDTRTPSPEQRNGPTDGDTNLAGDYKPDLSAEVAMLSTKLVNAINFQTNLDDSLQQARHDLEQAQAEVARVRAEKKSLDDMVASGLLMRRSHVDKEINSFQEELAAEKAAREAAEKAKKETEGELENLTAALFEEANTMVAAARKDAVAIEKRNAQLRGQLSDTQVLLVNQQEQLYDLKQTVERMSHESQTMSVPTTPIDRTTAAFDALQLSPHGFSGADVSPEHPLHFSQLVIPVLRHDVAAFTDFQDLLYLARRVTPHSRTGSNNTNSFASSSTPDLRSTSSPNLPGAFAFSSSSANNSPQSTTFNNQPVPTLKETKFYKRIAVEDLEPCLRLDLAPGLSFLSRRSVLSSLLSGSLVVEPFLQPSNRLYASSIYACALCGESRKNELCIRKHRFRISEDAGAQRYPLCDYCLNRIRAAGDFVGFLRMVRDGHWKAESEEEQRSAWEESVRLRERMFWARLGGGVVPAVHVQAQARRDQVGPGSPNTTAGMKSARVSVESAPPSSSSPERARNDYVIAAASTVTETDDSGHRSRGGTLGEAGDSLDGASSSTAAASTPGGIMRAIGSTSSDVSGTARPDVTPHRAATVSTPPSLPPSAESQEDEATTPAFEDAQDSQGEQAEASEQLEREAEEASSFSSYAPQQVPIVKEPVTEEKTKRNSSAASRDHSTATGLASPQAPPNERRPSAVLARVRAMEAKAQGDKDRSLPGAFD